MADQPQPGSQPDPTDPNSLPPAPDQTPPPAPDQTPPSASELPPASASNPGPEASPDPASPPPTPPPAAKPRRRRPPRGLVEMRVDHPRHGLHRWCRKALRLLARHNRPRPVIFQRGPNLIRVRPPGPAGEPPAIEIMTRERMRQRLTEIADFKHITTNSRGADVVNDFGPPQPLVDNLLAMPAWPTRHFAALDSVIDTPRFDAAGGMITRRGFHRAARVYLAPAPGLVLPPIPERPTPGDVAAARDLIVGELLADIPFADGPSRAAAVAAMLLPSLRAMIPGPTPWHVINGSGPGVGKSLLTTCLAMPSAGGEVAVMPPRGNDDEWRKSITSTLLGAPSFLVIDNLPQDRTVDSAALASALTARRWRDRVLGTSGNAELAVSCAWMATGNGVRLSEELERRSVRIELRVDAERPWERDPAAFRHPLPGWAADRRAELLGATLTLGAAWIAAGRPRGPKSLGSYEAWAEVLGGVLEVAGIPGLLEADRAVDEGEARRWRALVNSWNRSSSRRDGLGGTAKLTDLYELIQTDDALALHFARVLGDRSLHQQRLRLDDALRAQARRVWNGHRIEPAREIADLPAYRLVRVAEPESHPRPAPEPHPRPDPEAEDRKVRELLDELYEADAEPPAPDAPPGAAPAA